VHLKLDDITILSLFLQIFHGIPRAYFCSGEAIPYLNTQYENNKKCFLLPATKRVLYGG
jgi:hypothetical protein